MTGHSGRLLTEAVIEALEAVYLNVGDSIKPDGGGWQGAAGDSEFVPYTIVNPVPGGFSTGTLQVPSDDVNPDYIISSFGSTARQAQWGDDAVRAVLTAPGAVTVAGRRVMLITPDVDGGVVRDDNVTPPVFYAPTRWRFMTTDNGPVPTP